jgi:hypothetical protein
MRVGSVSAVAATAIAIAAPFSSSKRSAVADGNDGGNGVVKGSSNGHYSSPPEF